MQQEEQLLLLLTGINLLQFEVVILLIIDIQRNPSEIRLSVRETIHRLRRREPLLLQLAFLNILFLRFGRELLASILFCYTLWVFYKVIF